MDARMDARLQKVETNVYATMKQIQKMETNVNDIKEMLITLTKKQEWI